MGDQAPLVWAIGFGLLGSAGAVLVAAVFLALRDPVRTALVPCLVSYAAGSLLGAALLGLLPDALAAGNARPILATLLAGIVLFFVLERALLWHHCHDRDCERHRAAGPLLLVGDALHNFADGAIVAGAFLTSVPLGIGTGLAVLAHEIPQEFGDFGILLESGFTRRSALLWNLASASPTLVGAVAGSLLLAEARSALPYVMALSAASFLYIAMADLLPHLHELGARRGFVGQFLLMLAGIGTIVAVRGLLS